MIEKRPAIIAGRFSRFFILMINYSRDAVYKIFTIADLSYGYE